MASSERTRSSSLFSAKSVRYLAFILYPCEPHSAAFPFLRVLYRHLTWCNLAGKLPCEIHLCVYRRSRHASFTKHQDASPKQEHDADDPDGDGHPSIGIEKSGDGDRDAS